MNTMEEAMMARPVVLNKDDHPTARRSSGTTLRDALVADLMGKNNVARSVADSLLKHKLRRINR